MTLTQQAELSQRNQWETLHLPGIFSGSLKIQTDSPVFTSPLKLLSLLSNH